MTQVGEVKVAVVTDLSKWKATEVGKDLRAIKDGLQEMKAKFRFDNELQEFVRLENKSDELAKSLSKAADSADELAKKKKELSRSLKGAKGDLGDVVSASNALTAAMGANASSVGQLSASIGNAFAAYASGGAIAVAAAAAIGAVSMLTSHLEKTRKAAEEARQAIRDAFNAAVDNKDRAESQVTDLRARIQLIGLGAGEAAESQAAYSMRDISTRALQDVQSGDKDRIEVGKKALSEFAEAVRLAGDAARKEEAHRAEEDKKRTAKQEADEKMREAASVARAEADRLAAAQTRALVESMAANSRYLAEHGTLDVVDSIKEPFADVQEATEEELEEINRMFAVGSDALGEVVYEWKENAAQLSRLDDAAMMAGDALQGMALGGNLGSFVPAIGEAIGMAAGGPIGAQAGGVIANAIMDAFSRVTLQLGKVFDRITSSKGGAAFRDAYDSLGSQQSTGALAGSLTFLGPIGAVGVGAAMAAGSLVLLSTHTAPFAEMVEVLGLAFERLIAPLGRYWIAMQPLAGAAIIVGGALMGMMVHMLGIGNAVEWITVGTSLFLREIQRVGVGMSTLVEWIAGFIGDDEMEKQARRAREGFEDLDVDSAQRAYDMMAAQVNATEDNTEAIKEWGRELTNMPSGYRTFGAEYASQTNTARTARGGTDPYARRGGRGEVNIQSMTIVASNADVFDQIQAAARRRFGTPRPYGPRGND